MCLRFPAFHGWFNNKIYLKTTLRKCTNVSLSIRFLRVNIV